MARAHACMFRCASHQPEENHHPSGAYMGEDLLAYKKMHARTSPRWHVFLMPQKVQAQTPTKRVVETDCNSTLVPVSSAWR
eukprot:scaffold2955_cov17-Tisochrysis_lutea.AAC.1